MPELYIQAFRAGIMIVCSLRCYTTATTHDSPIGSKCLKLNLRHNVIITSVASCIPGCAVGPPGPAVTARSSGCAAYQPGAGSLSPVLSRNSLPALCRNPGKGNACYRGAHETPVAPLTCVGKYRETCAIAARMNACRAVDLGREVLGCTAIGVGVVGWVCWKG